MSDRRWRPSSGSSSLSSSYGSKAPIVMGFLSCIAWLYIAGRLWQDADNRLILSSLLHQNSLQVTAPPVTTVEDKLRNLGCEEIGQRIAKAEMELTLAKSQGFLRHNKSSSSRRYLVVIGVYTGFGSRLKRNMFRGSWMPRDDAMKKLEERGVIIRFVIGRSPNRGDSFDRNIDKENQQTRDFLILDNHEEAADDLAKKAQFFFSTAVDTWDAEFYVKVDDNINLDLEGLIEILKSHRERRAAYVGCMKSGVVINDVKGQWYEPDWKNFGDGKAYFRHASGSLFILSRSLARYININSGSLKFYAHDDTSVGAWMMGLNATYVDDNRLCCSGSRTGKICYSA